jgi:prepilin-type N-terminal cleavage/methylation domain-containing protein
MPYKKDKGFNLTEILVVVIIIAILVILSLPRYTETRERALAREAIANLKLISVAEKIYHMKLSTYWPRSGNEETNPATIGAELKLSLTEMNWDYLINGGTDSVTAYANRTTGPYSGKCSYSVTINQTYSFDREPTKGSGCP